MITYNSEAVKLPKFSKRDVSKWIKEVAAVYGKKVGEIGYLFCDDNKILEVNKQYLNHDYFTDIITFGYSEDDVISGDIYISLDTVKSNAEEFKVDYMDEFYRVIIHGVLHLCCQNDKSDEERAEMIRKENAALAMIER